MTVSVQETRFPHLANGVTVDFSFGCLIQSVDDLVVTVDGVQVTSGFTVSGYGNATGGTVTFSTPPVDGLVVVIERVIKLKRTTDYQQTGDFLSRVVNPDFDRLWQALQQFESLLGAAPGADVRVLRLGAGDTNGSGAYRAQNNRIQDISDPVAPQDAATKSWIQTQLASLATDGSGQFVLQLLAASTGAALVGFLQSGSGAVSRTQQDKSRDYVTIKDFGPALDGVTNDSTKLQNALNSGAKVVDFLGKQAKINSSLTIPAGVEARNVNLVAGTAGMNMVLVNTGSKVSGLLTGTGTKSIVERGIYPAADAVADVVLDVKVQNITYGVHAQYITTDTTANYPRRWRGTVQFENIVGTVGTSEGYGLLLSPALDCDLRVFAKTIQRHAVYLSAGASHNNVYFDVDGCQNVVCQINTTTAQNPSQYNTLRGKIRNVSVAAGGGAGQAVGVYVMTNSHYNDISIDMEGGGTAEAAVVFEGGSTTASQPTGNKVHDGAIRGTFLGADVIKCLGDGYNRIYNNIIEAYGTANIIALRTNGARSAPWQGPAVYDNFINGQGQNVIGIYDEITDAATYVGLNQIKNNGTAARVQDNTGGKRQGRSRKVVFSGTTASIAASGVGDTTVTLPDNIQVTNRIAQVGLTGSSGSFFGAAFWAAVQSAPAETQLVFRTYNGSGSAQTFTYSGWVEGD